MSGRRTDQAGPPARRVAFAATLSGQHRARDEASLLSWGAFAELEAGPVADRAPSTLDVGAAAPAASARPILWSDVRTWPRGVQAFALAWVAVAVVSAAGASGAAVNAAAEAWAHRAYLVVALFGGGLLALLSALMLATALVRLHRQASAAREVKATAEVQATALAVLAGTLSPAQGGVALEGWSVSLLMASLSPLRAALRGPELDRLLALYEALHLGRRAARMTRSSRWWRRLEGVRLVAAAMSTQPRGEREILLARLRDRHPLVRQAAARALAPLADTALTPELIAALTPLQTDERAAVTRTLLRVGALAPEGLADLLAKGDDAFAEPALRALALEALAESRSKAAVPVLVRGLRDRAPRVRAAAARALSALRAPLPPGPVAAALCDPDPDVVVAAAPLAAALGDAQLLPWLTRALQHPTWRVRLAAAESLAQFGDLGVRTLGSAADVDAGAAQVAERVMAERRGADRALMDFEASLLAPMPKSAALSARPHALDPRSWAPPTQPALAAL